MRKTIKWNLAQKAELTWWKNYLRGKDDAEYLVWKKNYWNSVLSEIAESCTVNNGMNVLDAGCGPAGIFIALPNCSVDAVDPLMNDYEKNLSHFSKADYPNVEFHHSPLETYSSNKQYDVIFCLNAINHVSDINLSYDHLTSMLKPGGKMVVSIDAHNFLFFKYLFRIIPGDILHPHQYDLNEYSSFLTERNCKIVGTKRLKHEFIFDHYVHIAERIG